MKLRVNPTCECKSKIKSQRKNTILNRRYIFKWAMFHCQFSLHKLEVVHHLHSGSVLAPGDFLFGGCIDIRHQPLGAKRTIQNCTVEQLNTKCKIQRVASHRKSWQPHLQFISPPKKTMVNLPSPVSYYQFTPQNLPIYHSFSMHFFEMSGELIHLPTLNPHFPASKMAAPRCNRYRLLGRKRWNDPWAQWDNQVFGSHPRSRPLST